MPLPRALPLHAKDALRRGTSFCENITKRWSSAWKTQKKCRAFDLIACYCLKVPRNKSHAASNSCIVSGGLLDVLRRVFAGRSCDCALLSWFSLKNLAFVCIFVVYWCIFAYFWSDVLDFVPSKCTLVFIISHPNEKLPCTMKSGQRHRQKKPKCELCVSWINPCVIHHSSHTTRHSARHLIDPIFAFSVSIRVVT